MRAVIEQMTLVNWVLTQQGVRLDGTLQAISDFIDEQGDVVERVRQDLERGLKRPQTGRRGLSAPQVLRSLVLMRVKNWDYRELRDRIADGITLRQFTAFHGEPVPGHDAFNRGGFQSRRLISDLRAIFDNCSWK